MKINYKNTLLIALAILTVSLISCREKQSNYTKIEPAHVDHLEGSKISKLTLTKKAAERIDIQTTSIKEEPTSKTDPTIRKVIPYSSVLYDIEGMSWVYTNPDPLVYIRKEIKIDFIEKQKVILTEGPPTGTVIVTQGASELLGTEYHVGH